MSENTTPALSADQRDSARIMSIVEDAADAAFRVRVRAAIQRFMHVVGHGNQLAESRARAGINVHRWIALRKSTRAAASPEEFQNLARVLCVSPRWLATGFGSPAVVERPPEGWEFLGAHVDRPDEPLEFSERTGEDGLPLWERSLAANPAAPLPREAAAAPVAVPLGGDL